MKTNIPENIKIEELLPLKQQEIDLLWLIRNKYQFGTLEILTRDGLPTDILQTIKRTRVGNLYKDLSTD